MIGKMSGLMLIFLVTIVSFPQIESFQCLFKRSARISTSTFSEVDPNFEEHLPAMLRAGSKDRTSPDLANDLRKKYKVVENKKREAAAVLKATNEELAAELEELADELSETSEKFVKAAEAWDAWNRPDPDLPRKLRNSNKKPENDPNFEEHLPGFLKKGLEERPDAELPSALRLLKYKSSVSVKRLAAAELRTSNEELAAEMEEIADEMEETHAMFEKMARSFEAMKRSENSVEKGEE